MHIVMATAPRGGGAIERSKIPPLGLAFLGASVERAGMQVTIVDVHTDNLDVETSAKAILAAGPEIVGVSCLSHNRFQAIDMIKALKREDGQEYDNNDAHPKGHGAGDFAAGNHDGIEALRGREFPAQALLLFTKAAKVRLSHDDGTIDDNSEVDGSET